MKSRDRVYENIYKRKKYEEKSNEMNTSEQDLRLRRLIFARKYSVFKMHDTIWTWFDDFQI